MIYKGPFTEEYSVQSLWSFKNQYKEMPLPILLMADQYSFSI